jgi:hypothetical protein
MEIRPVWFGEVLSGRINVGDLLSKITGIATSDKLCDMYNHATPAQQELFDKRMTILLSIKVFILALGVAVLVVAHWIYGYCGLAKLIRVR